MNTLDSNLTRIADVALDCFGFRATVALAVLAGLAFSAAVFFVSFGLTLMVIR